MLGMNSTLFHALFAKVIVNALKAFVADTYYWAAVAPVAKHVLEHYTILFIIIIVRFFTSKGVWKEAITF